MRVPVFVAISHVSEAMFPTFLKDPSQKHNVNHLLFDAYLDKRGISRAGSIYLGNIVICSSLCSCDRSIIQKCVQ